MIVIQESGMEFGPFEESDCFLIEESEAIRDLGEGIKLPEFVVYIKPAHGAAGYVAVVEAKSSIPKDSQEFLTEIKEKYINALTIFCASLLGRLPEVLSDMPSGLRNFPAQTKMKLILVIPTVPDQHLPDITDSLREKLKIDRKLWGLQYQDILAVNKRLAIKQGFCS